MNPTINLQKLVSTQAGMRRILKRPQPVERFIRQAVEAGVYQGTDDNNRAVPLRRRRSPRGATIEDYPIEYQILKMNPPLPEAPRVPKKFRRQQAAASKLPTDQLVLNYLKREQQKHQEESSLQSTQDYYERLLGIPPPKGSTAMGQKSTQLNKAYAFAIKQYEVMRLQNMSEDESLEIVEELLAQESKQERKQSRQTVEQVKEWMAEMDQQVETAAPPSDTAKTPADDTTSVPSILYMNPRAVQAMTIWSKRLESVPYREWTVGATVALDHWIARSILNLSEETWEALLEGSDPSLTGLGRDVISVRRALFPETNLQQHDDKEADSADEPSSVDKGIDELLATLGGGSFEDEEAMSSFWDDYPKEGEELDDSIGRLMDKLQTWRAKNVEIPYDQWEERQQDDFMDFVKEFVDTVSNGKEREEVDLVETRKALLASPPNTREESKNFWDSVRDETEAEIFLQSMLDQGVPEAPENESQVERKAREAHEIFLSLPYEVQLQKLLDLGTLRPIHDEFIAESERKRFFARYGDKLLAGMELEHLVPDPDGPITGSFLGSWWAENYGIKKTDRFRLEMMKYDTDGFGHESSQRARELYRAWNAHKANRARYEEDMFKRGELGLSYPPKEEKKK